MSLLSNREEFDKTAIHKLQETWLNEIVQTAEQRPSCTIFHEKSHEKTDGAIEAARRMLDQTESGIMRSRITSLIISLELHREKLSKGES